MVLWGRNGLEGGLRIEWRSAFWRINYWGRWLGESRVYLHLGPLVISWRRKD